MPLVTIVIAAFGLILLLALLARVVRGSRFATLVVNIFAGSALVVLVGALGAMVRP